MMTRRTLIVRLAAAAALLLPLPALAQETPALAQETPASASADAPAPKRQKVAIDTSAGQIIVELEVERAPITSRNFLRYLDQKRLDGTSFYRTVKVDTKFGFVQFGVDNDPKRVLPPIKHEPTTQTGVKHVNGAISVARWAPGTAKGEFTISVGDQPSLDANPDLPGDSAGYAAFGRVIEGMEVVWKILDAPTSPTLGEGIMKGQMLSPRIRINKVTRLP